MTSLEPQTPIDGPHLLLLLHYISSRPRLLSSWITEKPLRCSRLHLNRPSQQSMVQMET